MSKSYKASKAFSHGGKTYAEGQEIDITDEEILAVLERRELISGGKGTPAADIEAAKRKELAAKSAEADKKAEEEAKKREDEFIAQGGRPKKSTRMTTDDQTGGIKEKDDKSGPNAPKK